MVASSPPIDDRAYKPTRARRARQGPQTASSATPTCGNGRTGARGERLRRPQSRGCPAPKPLGASGPSARRRWRTTSSSGRRSRCSTPSTRRSVGVSRRAPDQAATRTPRWMRSRWGVKSAASTGDAMPPGGGCTRRSTTPGGCSASRTALGTCASSAPCARGSKRACWKMGSGDRRRQGRPEGAVILPGQSAQDVVQSFCT